MSKERGKHYTRNSASKKKDLHSFLRPRTHIEGGDISLNKLELIFPKTSVVLQLCASPSYSDLIQKTDE